MCVCLCKRHRDRDTEREIIYFSRYCFTFCETAVGQCSCRLTGKESAFSAGAASSIPGSGRSPGEGYDNPLQYSCLRNPWTEEPGGLQSMRSWRVRHDWGKLGSMHKLLSKAKKTFNQDIFLDNKFKNMSSQKGSAMYQSCCLTFSVE